MTSPTMTNFTNMTSGLEPGPTPRTCPMEMYTQSSYVVARWISINRFYIQLPIAVVGAIMVFLVYGSRMTKKSPYLLMCTLALADASFILMDLVFHKIPTKLADFDPGNVGCGIIEYLFHVTQMFAVGVLVFMMFERMLVLLLPLRLNFISATSTAIALSLLLLSVLAINVPFTYAKISKYTVNRLTKNTYYSCLYDSAQYAKHLIPLIYIKMYVFYFIAMGILLFCSIATAIKICCMKKALDVDNKINDVENRMRNSHMTPRLVSRGNDKADDILRDITIQALTVSIFFIILALPYGITYVPYSPISHLGTRKRLTLTCDESFFIYVFSEISKLLYDMQHCLNAYLYCLSGRLFRRELVRKLTCRKQKSDKYIMSETAMTEMPKLSSDETANGKGPDVNMNGRF